MTLLLISIAVLFADITFQGTITWQDNQAMITANINNSNSVEKNVVLQVNDQIIIFDPILGYCSGISELQPGDEINVLLKNLDGVILYQKRSSLPQRPAFDAINKEINGEHPAFFQWAPLNKVTAFGYATEKEDIFYKCFHHYENNVEVSELKAGKGYVSLYAFGGDTNILKSKETHSDSYLLTAVGIQEEISVKINSYNIRAKELKSTKQELKPVKSWTDKFEIPKVGKKTFELNAYMVPANGIFTVSGRNRRFKSSVIVVYYKDNVIWTWDRVYKFKKKRFNQSFPLKMKDVIVVATRKIRWGVDFK